MAQYLITACHNDLFSHFLIYSHRMTGWIYSITLKQFTLNNWQKIYGLDFLFREKKIIKISIHAKLWSYSIVKAQLLSSLSSLLAICNERQ